MLKECSIHSRTSKSTVLNALLNSKRVRNVRLYVIPITKTDVVIKYLNLTYCIFYPTTVKPKRTVAVIAVYIPIFLYAPS